MASLNKVMLIGRLTDDPEPARTLPNSGSTVVKFRFAVGRGRKNPQTGQWENDPNPLYLDCEAFTSPGQNRDLCRVVADFCRRGSEVFLEGRLAYETWDDKNGGGKRSKLFITVETFQYLDAKQEGGQQQAPQRQQRPAPSPSWGNPAADPFAPSSPPRPSQGGSADEIPFAWLTPLLIAVGSMFTII